MDRLIRVLGSERSLRGWSVALLVANCGIVLTGALVRLTGSGLGCPTWPRCTDESYVTTPEMGVHGVIEFGNRLLTFVLILIAVATVAAATAHAHVDARRPDGPRGHRVRLLAVGLTVGVPFQGVIGGLTVHSGLNPYVVALHLLLSVLLICLSVWLVRIVHGASRQPVDGPRLWLGRAVFVLAWLASWLGTVVTGSGPHAGDDHAPRTGLDIETVAKVHAWSVWALVLATVVAVVLLRSRAAVLLLVLELAQGVVGYVQYFTGVPVPLVMLHMLGLCLVMAAATNLMFSLRRPTAADSGRAPSEAIGIAAG
ncbi:heme A synthase [Auraticoccus sp. F435]|uniref:Heme A synthase n=1 Tax=Auraticoccus cholistanensis TaxID=2656650 RepID=A0A6A9UZ37_9ACTN|nr:COX15/CtaA family protein [Auraticoccus cholistanensis]MVA77222.1 heme A synthase [Auraticoccus cholistanensis]